MESCVPVTRCVADQTLLPDFVARIWTICSYVFQETMSHVCTDFNFTWQAWPVSDSKANAFRKSAFIFFLLVFFSIISYKTNPAGMASSCFGVFSFLVPPSCTASLGGRRCLRPSGERKCLLDPYYQWSLWLTPIAGLTWVFSELLFCLGCLLLLGCGSGNAWPASLLS